MNYIILVDTYDPSTLILSASAKAASGLTGDFLLVFNLM